MKLFILICLLPILSYSQVKIKPSRLDRVVVVDIYINDTTKNNKPIILNEDMELDPEYIERDFNGTEEKVIRNKEYIGLTDQEIYYKKLKKIAIEKNKKNGKN
ncbi:MAG: hypothetical protein M0R46_06400 [Candidatus Muirbacterium halophilum]|nr:hypothetical protein [Candidatus Muirbacterium halophilum]